MWKNPYYFFRIPYFDNLGEKKFREFIIDVVRSAKFKEPSPDLKFVLNILIGKNSEYEINSVLDFACGKLSTVDHILSKKKNLTVVDFKDILDRYNYLITKLDRLNSNELFNKMDFPNPFINDTKKFDLAILVNCLPIMPVFLERLLVLQILNGKIREGKFLLWFTMKNPSVYRNRARVNSTHLGDGIWIGQENYKTFYKFHAPDYINLLMYLSGFHLERIIKAENDAILFKKTKYNLIENLINQKLIIELIKSQMSMENDELKPLVGDGIEVNPYPEDYDLFNIIKNLLNNLKPGTKDQNYFKRLSAGLIQFLFFNQLTGMVIEDPMNEGRDLVDITFQTTDSLGFFKRLQDPNVYNTKCPIIFIECKNIKDKLTNQEYQQLSDRLGPERGQFGLIICRNKVDEKEVLKHCKDRLKKGVIIVLDDNDLLKLFKLRVEDGEEAVNIYFEKEIKKLLM